MSEEQPVERHDAGPVAARLAALARCLEDRGAEEAPTAAHLARAVRRLERDLERLRFVEVAARLDAERRDLGEWIADLPPAERPDFLHELATAADRSRRDGDIDEVVTVLAEWMTTADAHREGLLDDRPRP